MKMEYMKGLCMYFYSSVKFYVLNAIISLSD